MLQVETLLQSMVDIKTVVLKARLDRGDIRYIGEKVKPQLFSKFGLKPKPEDIKLLASEEYFEPYFIIGGKYVLDYCKKHVFEAEVDKKTTKVFVAGQEFNSKEFDPKTRRRVVELTGEEHLHHEKQGYYILDRMNREIPPERLLLSPFVIREKRSELNYPFKRMHIPDETQINFLKTKIAQRPADVAEIIKEIFEITDRTIAYYPMYLLTFENAKKRKEATVTVDGITGETVPNGIRNIDGKTILTSREVLESQIAEPVVREDVQTEPQIEPIPDVVPCVVKDQVRVSPKNDHITEAKPVVCEKARAGAVLEAVSPVAKNGMENASKDNQIVQTTQPEKTIEQEQTEPMYILPFGATDNTLNVPKERGTIQPTQPDDSEPTILGFPARILGEVVEMDDNGATIDGDVEIPSGTNINKNLVVKGSLKVGDNCRGRGKLRAFKDITIGTDTIIDGDLISGGNIFVGPRSLINGVVEASGVFEIEENAVVEGVCLQTPPSK